MASLTQTAYLARKIIKFGSIGLVFLIIFRVLYLNFKTYWKKTHPPAPPAPTTAFGKLPKLSFPEQKNLPNLTIKLENISGVLPKLADQAKVFFMPKASSNLLAWDKTKVWARSLGFSFDPQATGEFTYRFTTDTSPKTVLDVDVLTRNFTLVYDWQNDLQILSAGNPPQEDQCISSARSFLQNADVLVDDLVQGKSEVSYQKYDNGNLAKALFFSEANFALVNLFRNDIDNLKVLPPNPKQSNIYVRLSAAKDRSRSIIEIRYIHFPVSWDNFATYPLKDATSAWNSLKSGAGYVANLGNNPEGNILIRNVYLAYYDNDRHQDFLQPIIVFEGDNDFFAYVPAISDSWTVQ
ncbi:hypothetical protein COT64_00770 [Candidatus Shapirobacteria bacterium CG09_land_8_20_14_0_10_39_12]|uniref:Uncharacterized protein n=1 Tax=Candidatus Shapirobacteria bacterium CG09_land_8_20_14_0_10_39_12 TaxID=1974885 RepID=A0A2H0WQ90_9BACT|nr:MAG: hypothetical protein COT64_00770 [Candidatus Shapirobacteria bacterium CG09_land_8_20_14_0_10_39_12]